MFYLEIAEKVAELTKTKLVNVLESPRSSSMYFTYENEKGNKKFDIRMSGHSAVGAGKCYSYDYDCGLITLGERQDDGTYTYQPTRCLDKDEYGDIEIIDWCDAHEDNWAKYISQEEAISIMAEVIAFDIQ
jgi:hypothetical protein